ncbi:MAG TPA: TolC family protein [Puia sp.]|jgi:outer membrane protein TolC
MITVEKLAGFLLFLLPLGQMHAQQPPVTLEQCYQLAEANYPLTRQRALIGKTREYTIDNIRKGVYPQFTVNGTATYQSDVTKISLPAINGLDLNIPTVPKDQYKFYGEVSQTLTDFGINKEKRTISATDAQIQQENLNTELYKLKDRINQLFFGILLIDGQLKENDLSAQDIRTGISKVQAAINNGTDFKSSLNKLQAELLTNRQHGIDLKATRKSYIDMLALFLNKDIDDSTTFQRPAPPTLTDSVSRPELKAFDLQTQAYIEHQRLTRITLNPQLNAFFQGGLGKPNPVNFLSTQLSAYYLTGLRLTWNFGGIYTYNKDKLINKNNQEMVQAQRNTFLFNTSVTLRQQNADIIRYQQLIQTDNEIVDLRDSVKQTSAVQLQNGVITANDYLLDINAETRARQDRNLHEIQLLLSQYSHKTTTGQ